jgi:hypothetical protein
VYQRKIIISTVITACLASLAACSSKQGGGALDCDKIDPIKVAAEPLDGAASLSINTNDLADGESDEDVSIEIMRDFKGGYSIEHSMRNSDEPFRSIVVAGGRVFVLPIVDGETVAGWSVMGEDHKPGADEIAETLDRSMNNMITGEESVLYGFYQFQDTLGSNFENWDRWERTDTKTNDGCEFDFTGERSTVSIHVNDSGDLSSFYYSDGNTYADLRASYTAAGITTPSPMSDGPDGVLVPNTDGMRNTASAVRRQVLAVAAQFATQTEIPASVIFVALEDMGENPGLIIDAISPGGKRERVFFNTVSKDAATTLETVQWLEISKDEETVCVDLSRDNEDEAIKNSACTW